jgi:hypothetical protein
MSAAKIGTGIAAKKLVSKVVKKSPRLQKTIANFKKLPLKKKIALIATGGLLAPLAPVLLPTVAAVGTGAAGILATKKAAQKIAAMRRNSQAASAAPDTVADEEKITIPVSARTEAGNIAAVKEASEAEPETSETVEKKPGSALKWLAPLAALPFFFGEI